MRKAIEYSVKEAQKVIQMLSSEKALEFIERLALLIVATYQRGNKVIIAGNGGSLCDAMHFAEELTGFYRKKRKALPAIALSDPGQISCIANDDSFEVVFARGVEAYGKKNDLFIALTTSGNSKNLICASATAKELGLKTCAFLGRGGGRMRGMCDLEWIISGFKYSDRVQEAHMSAIHIVIEMVEISLFPSLKEGQLEAQAVGIC